MAESELKRRHPLAEVFGFLTTDRSALAIAHRSQALCPFNNNEPKCTKDKKASPLGVCSIYHKGKSAIICPIRFREKWMIYSDAARFFFDPKTAWTPLKEIRLKDKSGGSAGNIDIVLAAHDKNGKIFDFGAVEIQSVYVSGNIRKPFEAFIKNPRKNELMDWSKAKNYPRPDYLSSSRKRLIPQLIYKGRILKSWGKKQVVVIDKSFYETILVKTSSDKHGADLCWLVYEQSLSQKTNRFEIALFKKIYEGFDDCIERITTPKIGSAGDFVSDLEKKLSEEMDFLKKNYGFWAFSQLLNGSNDEYDIQKRDNIPIQPGPI